MSNERGRPLIVGIGEILWDLLPTGKQLAGRRPISPIMRTALGAAGTAVSRVGKDDLGQEYPCPG